jgi:H+/Cl- antiporter ClcA
MNPAAKKPNGFWRNFTKAFVILIVARIFARLITHQPIFNGPFVWWDPIVYFLAFGVVAGIYAVGYHYLFLLISPQKSTNSR